jgi:predicted transcriptional regulator
MKKNDYVRKYKKPLCDLLERERVKANLSQSELARRVGVHQSSISEIENCSDNISIEYIIKVLTDWGFDISSIIPTCKDVLGSKNISKQLDEELSAVVSRFSDFGLSGVEVIGALDVVKARLLKYES